MIPFLLIFVGWEREAMLAICHLTVLLILTQLPKRFVWRYRPYMKSRAKMVGRMDGPSIQREIVKCMTSAMTFLSLLSLYTYLRDLITFSSPTTSRRLSRHGRWRAESFSPTSPSSCGTSVPTMMARRRRGCCSPWWRQLSS